MVEKVLRLLQRKERWLVVAGVRFLRTCIGTKVRQQRQQGLSRQQLQPAWQLFSTALGWDFSPCMTHVDCTWTPT